MNDRPSQAIRRFHPHENAHSLTLHGLPLASFWQRALGFFVDWLLALLLWVPLEVAWRYYIFHEEDIHLKWDFHEVGNILALLVYFGVSNYCGNGQTPGKRVARTRALSLTSERLSVWQSAERALGYGAAFLEGGLGFMQFFWDHNRMCAQDRLAETIVVDLRKQLQASK